VELFHILQFIIAWQHNITTVKIGRVGFLLAHPQLQRHDHIVRPYRSLKKLFVVFLKIFKSTSDQYTFGLALKTLGLFAPVTQAEVEKLLQQIPSSTC